MAAAGLRLDQGLLALATAAGLLLLSLGMAAPLVAALLLLVPGHKSYWGGHDGAEVVL